MLRIPLTDTPSQSFKVTLLGQACRIELRQNSTGLYCSLYVNDEPIVLGVVCRHVAPIVRSLYLGFLGDLLFVDLQGQQDPAYPGLDSRFALYYIEPGETFA